MVSPITQFLSSTSEISSAFITASVIVICLFMIVYITRDNDFNMRSTSVVQVRPPPTTEVKFNKVAVPFSCQLQSVLGRSVTLHIINDRDCCLHSFWGVSMENLHPIISMPWVQFYKKIKSLSHYGISKNVELKDEHPYSEEYSNLFDKAEPAMFIESSLSPHTVNLELPPTWSLGPPPRLKFPLVAILIRNLKSTINTSGINSRGTAQACKSSSSDDLNGLDESLSTMGGTYLRGPGRSLTLSEGSDGLERNSGETEENSGSDDIGATIYIFHIQDEHCPMSSTIMYSYIKQYNGELTKMMSLYTQKNDQLRSQSTSGFSSTGLREDPICVICLVDPPTRAFLPCRHVCVCGSCFGSLAECPLCRASISSYFLVGEETIEQEELGDDETTGTRTGIWGKLNRVLNRYLL